MKRFLLMVGISAVGLLSLFATPGSKAPNGFHKIFWCHFPPGLFPETAEIINIDVAADGSLIAGQHLNHQGDGPYAGPNGTDGTFQTQPPGKNNGAVRVTSGVPGQKPVGCGAATCAFPPQVESGCSFNTLPGCPTANSTDLVNLVNCKCPTGTSNAGLDPILNQNTNTLVCGINN